MTTTSVFQGIQEGAKLSSRVLKPPGGGSSISFFDDDVQTSSRSSPQPSAPSPNNIIDQEPNPNSPTPEDKGETSPVAPPSPKESNATGKDSTPESVPAAGAGQRQRIPPGGFSSRLW